MKYIRHVSSNSEANLQVFFVAGQVSTDSPISSLYRFQNNNSSLTNHSLLLFHLYLPQLWYEATRDIRKGEELVLGPKVPLQIRDMCNNNLFGLGAFSQQRDDDRSDRESGKSNS